MKKKHPVGAGMIVTRDFQELGIKVLLLKLSDESWDLPKGRLDPGESILECAVRETFEETCISHINFLWGHISIKLDNLTFFICATDEDPKILPNPVYGIYEHESAWWVDPEDAINILPDFLKPAMSWAISSLSQ